MTMRFAPLRRKLIASLAAATLLTPSLAEVARAQTGGSATAARPIDGGWPRAYLTPRNAQLIVSQPQIASWDARKQMVAYAALSYQPQGASKPSLGMVKVESATSVWLPDRLVRFSPVRVTETNFTSLGREELQDVASQITSGIPDSDRVIALDRVLASIDKSQIIPKNVESVKADPPAIIYSTRPAILVGFDGEPIWAAIEMNELKFAVNTNWDVFQHEATHSVYLRNGRVWLKASYVKGP